MANKELNKTPEQISFTNKEISEMKEMLEGIEIIDEDEVNKLKKESSEMYTDSIVLARLFLKCYYCLLTNLHVFRDNEKDYPSKLKKYLEFFNDLSIREDLEEFGDGNEFGSGYLKERIKDKVNKNRDEMINLILLFFGIFWEEE